MRLSGVTSQAARLPAGGCASVHRQRPPPAAPSSAARPRTQAPPAGCRRHLRTKLGHTCIGALLTGSPISHLAPVHEPASASRGAPASGV